MESCLITNLLYFLVQNLSQFRKYYLSFMRASNLKLLSLLVVIHFAASLQLEQSHQVVRYFCWRDSYGRGVGTIPDKCGERQKIGALCYDHCPSGYKRFGFDCHQTCPSGWTNNGLYCRHAEYGRGAGYPWKFGDGFNDKGMFKRCEKQHGKGNCEKNGAIVYPKCKSGYHNFGCCICRPKTPNCHKEGMNNGIDLSCAKKIKIGKPHGASCPDNKENDAGLCYKKCKTGYKGVGPVCWGKDPKGWVTCGMGSAKTDAYCASVVFDQMYSVGQMAMTVATLGTSAAATGTANAAAKAGKLAKLRKQFAAMKKAFQESKQIKKLVDKTKTVREVGTKTVKVASGAAAIGVVTYHVAAADPDKMTEEDIVRLAAEIASLLDPTGISSTVAAYTHPKCSEIFDL